MRLMFFSYDFWDFVTCDCRKLQNIYIYIVLLASQKFLQEKNDGGKDKDALGWFFKVLLKAGTGRLSASAIDAIPKITIFMGPQAW